MMSTVIASNLPHSISEDEVHKLFSFGGKASQIEEITPLDSEHETKTFRVQYDDPSQIRNALLLNGTEFKHSMVRVVEEALGGFLYGGQAA